MKLATKISSCTKSFSDKKKTLSDRRGSKSKYMIENPNGEKFSVIEFDHCVFDNEEEKCDYGVSSASSIHYIELKGANHKKGFSQLHNTIKLTQKHFKKEIKARLIVTKVNAPQLRKNNDYKALVKLVGGTLNGKKQLLVMKSGQFIEKLN